ncbi:hypothetical protein [Streptomyces flavidovirens]|uniref:hypothetical protein n=1 Tax=Streptomyces flavidovirens TaxID=67298 RepID=UPI00368F6CD2
MKQFFRAVVRVLALGVMASGVTALAAAPASAAVNWKPWSPPANLICKETITHHVYKDVGFQGCYIYNDKHEAQMVLIVINNGPKAINISGRIISDFGSNADCAASVLNPRIRVACYGPTKPTECDTVYDNTVQLVVNGSIKAGPGASVIRGCPFP